ncbi:hypothetical protein M433DRAFT_2963 [Acidomyces richmondensis BFW]|nr:MAG: hypothetical protein FE78DRAFT_29375 [Acidomyces sp. 'richmondensis']KYG47334.1 hypothetical protein M433DRAFT_2963 [Acidomyces richmondensis BFW]
MAAGRRCRPGFPATRRHGDTATRRQCDKRDPSAAGTNGWVFAGAATHSPRVLGTVDRGPWSVDRGPWTVDPGSRTVDCRPWTSPGWSTMMREQMSRLAKREMSHTRASDGGGLASGGSK